MSCWSRVALCLVLLSRLAFGLGQQKYVDPSAQPGSFPVVAGGVACSIYVDAADYTGVIRASGDLQSDIARVTAVTPAITNSKSHRGARVIIIGTIGKNSVIDALVHSGKINVAAIAGKWESFLIQVVPNPLPGVASALVIAGSDKRGTIYGIYDVSEQIGVSPWYWWADVPVQHKDALFVKPGSYVQGPPAVKYRGIFLNDEAPSLSGWVHEKYRQLQPRVLHEGLRTAAAAEGQLSLARHVEQRLQRRRSAESQARRRVRHRHGHLASRAHAAGAAGMEASRHRPLGLLDQLRRSCNKFWDEGIERNKNYESIITLGMRGDGDMPMSESANVALLEKIVADQRTIHRQPHEPRLSAKCRRTGRSIKKCRSITRKACACPTT